LVPNKHNARLVGLLETKVKPHNIMRMWQMHYKDGKVTRIPSQV